MVHLGGPDFGVRNRPKGKGGPIRLDLMEEGVHKTEAEKLVIEAFKNLADPPWSLNLDDLAAAKCVFKIEQVRLDHPISLSRPHPHPHNVFRQPSCMCSRTEYFSREPAADCRVR